LRQARQALAVAAGSALLVGCASYAQRADWDAKVTELCRTDGGVTVYEPVRLTRREFQASGGTGESFPIPWRAAAKPDAPYVMDNKTVWLSRTDPEVLRSETFIVRVNDGKVLSRLIDYARVGRDFVRPYGCGDVGIRLDLEHQTFRVIDD
jgi:hypothetical protein